MKRVFAITAFALLSSAALAAPPKKPAKPAARPSSPPPPPAPARAPAEDAPAPAPRGSPAPAAAAEAAAPSSRGGPTRVEFDDRLVQGQSNKQGAIYLFERKEAPLRSMLRKRKDFRAEMSDSVR